MAGNGGQAAGHGKAVPQRRVVIVLGRPDAGNAYRVEDPDRVLRMFELLTAARDEIDLMTVPAEGWARIQRLLEAVSLELKRSVSPALADEIDNVVSHPDATASVAELRVECASLLGWASGLVAAMLDQLSLAVPGEDEGPAPMGGTTLGAQGADRKRGITRPADAAPADSVAPMRRSHSSWRCPGHEHG